jgi:hypothetical protein
MTRTAGVALTLLLAASGCETGKLPPRQVLTAPYQREHLWAVVPPVNESGVSRVDTARLADMIAQQAQQVQRVSALPVNRVLAAMDQLGLEAVRSTGDATALMQLLGADGLIVGSVTAYDPYPPPTLGLALQLFSRSDDPGDTTIDPVQIERTTSGEILAGQLAAPVPVAQVAGIFDARDQRTLIDLQSYAASRHLPESAYGNDLYLVSMDLFAQFASHRLIRDLLHEERSRLIRMAAQPPVR